MCMCMCVCMCVCAGTTGHMLDLLARIPLWQAGLDYRHATAQP
jgi:Xaa-Pro aminopeptidase